MDHEFASSISLETNERSETNEPDEREVRVREVQSIHLDALPSLMVVIFHELGVIILGYNGYKVTSFNELLRVTGGLSLRLWKKKIRKQNMLSWRL